MNRSRGITLLELIVVVAVIGTIIALSAPSLKSLIVMQRLRSANSQIVTDLQLARAEAVTRRDFVRVTLRANPLSAPTTTCYTIYTSASNATRCNCLLGPGAACASGMVEIKTVSLPSALGVLVKPAATMSDNSFAFDWRTGSLLGSPTDSDPPSIDRFSIESSLVGSTSKLHTQVNQAGRPLVCRPTGSSMTETPCP